MTRTFGHVARMTALVLGTVVLSTAMVGNAVAQNSPVCTPHDRLVEHLSKSFGEAMTAAGVDGRGNLVQVFSSAEGSWTIVVTIPGGPTCVMSAGEGWTREQLATMPTGEERSS